MEDTKFSSSRGKKNAKSFSKPSTSFKKKAVSDIGFSQKPKSTRSSYSTHAGETSFVKKKKAFSDTGFSQKAKPEKKGYYTQSSEKPYSKNKISGENSFSDKPKKNSENNATESVFKKKRAFSETGFPQKAKPVKSGYYTQGNENKYKKKISEDNEDFDQKSKPSNNNFNKKQEGSIKRKRAFSETGFSQKAKPVKSGYYTQGTENKFKKKPFSNTILDKTPTTDNEEFTTKNSEGGLKRKRAYSDIGFSQKLKPKKEGYFTQNTEKKTFRRKTSNIDQGERASFRNSTNGRSNFNPDEESTSRFIKKTLKTKAEDDQQRNTEKKTPINKLSFDKRENHTYNKTKSLQPDYNFDKFEKRAKRRKKSEEQEGDIQGLVRLNRYISNAGICSRRDADMLIEAGEIKVNGIAITEFGFKVKPTDTVKYGNKILNREKLIYVLLNKPKDYITTTDDPEGRKTVMDLVRAAGSQRLYPVGRLDRNTTGLLLLTNDGELADKLTHPSNEIKKLYEVELDKPILQEHFEHILKGVKLEDGDVTVDEMATVSADKTMLGVQIHSGKNRVVRRIFESFGYEVVKLDRVMYAGLTKKETPRGQWRYLSEKEVITLKYLL